jgi:hypothetical protein
MRSLQTLSQATNPTSPEKEDVKFCALVKKLKKANMPTAQPKVAWWAFASVEQDIGFFAEPFAWHLEAAHL